MSTQLLLDRSLGRPVSLSAKALLSLQPSDVYTPEELSTYLAGYSPAGARADEVSPVQLVEREEFIYRTFDKKDAFQLVAVEGDSDADVPEIDLRSSTATGKTVDRFLGMFLPQRVVQQANFDVRMAGLRRLRAALEHHRENALWTTLTTTGSWTAGNVLALAGTQNWNGGADSDPLRDLHIAIEASAMPPTAVWMNQKVANAFLRHDRVRDHIRSMVGDDALGRAVGSVNADENTDFELPGLPTIRVSKRKYQSDAAGALSYSLPNSVVLVRATTATNEGDDINTSTTFRYQGESRTGFDAREFFDASRGGRGGIMLVAIVSDIAVMTASDVGGLITGVIA